MEVNKLYSDYERKVESYRGPFGYLSREKRHRKFFMYSLSLEKYL